MIHALVFLLMSAIPTADTAPLPTPIVRIGDFKAKSISFDPPEALEPKGGFAIYNPPADVKAVEYIALDGEEPFPASLIGGSPTAFVFFTRGLPQKSYRFVGVASDSGGKLTRKQFSVLVGVAPPKEGEPPVTPKDPPKEDPAGLYYFLVVRADGPATSHHKKVMEIPAWKTLRSAGHTVGDNTISEATAFGVKIPAGSSLPIVVILKGAKGDKVLKIVPLPTDSDAILELPKAVQ